MPSWGCNTLFIPPLRLQTTQIFQRRCPPWSLQAIRVSANSLGTYPCGGS